MGNNRYPTSTRTYSSCSTHDKKLPPMIYLDKFPMGICTKRNMNFLIEENKDLQKKKKECENAFEFLIECMPHGFGSKGYNQRLIKMLIKELKSYDKKLMELFNEGYKERGTRCRVK